MTVGSENIFLNDSRNDRVKRKALHLELYGAVVGDRGAEYLCFRLRLCGSGQLERTGVFRLAAAGRDDLRALQFRSREMHGVYFLCRLRHVLLHDNRDLHRRCRLNLIAVSIIDGEVKHILHLIAGCSCSSFVRCRICLVFNSGNRLLAVIFMLSVNVRDRGRLEHGILRNPAGRTVSCCNAVICALHADFPDTVAVCHFICGVSVSILCTVCIYILTCFRFSCIERSIFSAVTGPVFRPVFSCSGIVFRILLRRHSIRIIRSRFAIERKPAGAVLTRFIILQTCAGFLRTGFRSGIHGFTRFAFRIIFRYQLLLKHGKSSSDLAAVLIVSALCDRIIPVALDHGNGAGIDRRHDSHVRNRCAALLLIAQKYKITACIIRGISDRQYPLCIFQHPDPLSRPGRIHRNCSKINFCVIQAERSKIKTPVRIGLAVPVAVPRIAALNRPVC